VRINDDPENFNSTSAENGRRGTSTSQGLKSDNYPQSPDESMAVIQQRFAKFHDAKILKRLALTAIAGKLQDREIQDLTQKFHELDVDGDGKLSLAELTLGFQGLSKSVHLTTESCKMQNLSKSKTIQELFFTVDSDCSHEIEYTEFLAAAMDLRFHERRDLCWQAFQTFDTDGSGAISLNELKEIYFEQNDYAGNQKAYERDMKKIEECIKDYDVNGDGEICFEEFMLMMKG